MSKLGRPRKITAHIARKIFFLAGYGLTDDQLAEVFNLSTDTIQKYKHDANFLPALKKIKEQADLKVVNSLFKRAVGYDYFEQGATKDGPVELRKVMHPDVTACIFWLKNRQRENWRNVEAPAPAILENHTHINIGELTKLAKANLADTGARAFTPAPEVGPSVLQP